MYMDPEASKETEIDRQISVHHVLVVTLMTETAIAPNSNEEQLPLRKSSKKPFATMSIYISSVFGTYIFYNFCSVFSSRRRLRDTVSSVGVFRNKYYPGAELADNICFFRHALALDERRVKFLPEYVVAKKEWFSPGEFGRPRCKEVWFRGSHSGV
jgi:hypothetical protein